MASNKLSMGEMMKINKIAIMFSIICAIVRLSAQEISVPEPIERVLNKANLKKEGIAIIAFLNPGECVKCNLVLSSSIKWIKKSMTRQRVKFAGFVRCQREIDLKQYHWY